MPTTITLPADRLLAFCEDAAQRALDRGCELEDGSTQEELIKGTAKAVYAAFLTAAGLDWK